MLRCTTTKMYKKIGETYKINKATLVLKKLCLGLLTEDVLCNNDLFIEAIVSNSDILISYLDFREKDKQTSVRSRKSTGLYKTNHSLQEKLAQLSKLMVRPLRLILNSDKGYPI